MSRLVYEDLSEVIIGVAMEVLNELKLGLDETLYERAMVIELRRRGHAGEAQRGFPVFSRDELIWLVFSRKLRNQEIMSCVSKHD